MIKKHQKFLISGTYQRTSLKQLFFCIIFHSKIYLIESLIQKFVISFFYFTFTYVHLVKYIPFYSKQFSTSFNLIKKESYSFPGDIFLSIFALNMCSIKTHQRSVIKILTTLLIKQ